MKRLYCKRIQIITTVHLEHYNCCHIPILIKLVQAHTLLLKTQLFKIARNLDYTHSLSYTREQTYAACPTRLSKGSVVSLQKASDDQSHCYSAALSDILDYSAWAHIHYVHDVVYLYHDAVKLHALLIMFRYYTLA